MNTLDFGCLFLCPLWSLSAGQNPDFDFYHSQVRINIECAFGMLTQRWRILWAPLECGEATRPALIVALMKLHNWCINDATEHRVHDGEPLFQSFGDDRNASSTGMWPQAPEFRTHDHRNPNIPYGDAALPVVALNSKSLLYDGTPCHIAWAPRRQPTTDSARNKKRLEIIKKLEDLQLKRPNARNKRSHTSIT